MIDRDQAIEYLDRAISVVAFIIILPGLAFIAVVYGICVYITLILKKLIKRW